MAQWGYRQRVWREVDEEARQFLNDACARLEKNPLRIPVFTSVPGMIGDVPVFMHFFDMRLRLESGRQDITPVALSYAVYPAGAERQRVNTVQTGLDVWELSVDSPKAWFAFPDAAAYRHVPDVAGLRVASPWTDTEVLRTGPLGHATAIRVRLKLPPSAVPSQDIGVIR
jgi:hypothetical protein